MATESIPFGQDPTGRMVDATEVPSGLACRCICPACNTSLVAKKGEIKRPHFAHQADQSHCTAALESSLHRMAKQLYMEMQFIRLPAMELSSIVVFPDGFQHTGRRIVPLTGGIFRFTTVDIEISYGPVRPDVVLHGSFPLMVEVLVTHAVDEQKAALLRAGGHACVEIDLGNLHRNADVAALREVLQGPTVYRWIHHPDAVDLATALEEKVQDQASKAHARWLAQQESQRLADEEFREELLRLKQQRADQRIAQQERLAKEAELHRRKLESLKARTGSSFDERYESRLPGNTAEAAAAMLVIQNAILSDRELLLSEDGQRRLYSYIRFRAHLLSDEAARQLVLRYLGASNPEEGYNRLTQGLVQLVQASMEVICTACGSLQEIDVTYIPAGHHIIECRDCHEYIDIGRPI